MSSGTNIIREFLVSLGYKIDGNSERKFVGAVQSASKEVLKLGTAAVAAATAVTAAVTKIASDLEGLYFTAQRTKSSAQNILALGFAADQLGSSASAARGSVESLALFMNSNPGSEGLIHSLGVQTRDANGQLRDTTDILQDMGKQFARMPKYMAIARANVFGIDYKTLLALEQGTDKFGKQYKGIIARFGLDTEKATQKAHEFMVQLREVKAAGELLLMSAGSKLIEWIDDLVHWWDSLDRGTKKNIEGIAAFGAGIAAAAAIIASGPIGWIAALGGAILLLWQDYKVWKEGGKSLIDWGKWKPEIDLAKSAFSVLGDLARQAGEGFRIMGGWIADAFHWLERILDKLEHSAAGRWVLSKIKGMKEFMTPYVQAQKAAVSELLGDAAGGDNKARSDARNLGHALGQVFNQVTGQAYEHGHPDSQTGSGSLGIRNNNPGNLRTGPGGSFGKYDTAQSGLSALAHQLRLYYTGASSAAGHRRLQTIRDIIGTYAPRSENNTPAYISAIAKQMGMAPDAQLNLNDPAQLASLMRGIVAHENGYNPYSAELFNLAARSAEPTAAKGTSLTQTITISVNGSGNPEATARAVANEQDRVNNRLVRNLKGAAA